MRVKPLKTRDLILSLSKDEAKISCFFSSLLPCSLQGGGRAEIVSPKPLPKDRELPQRGRMEKHHLTLHKPVIQQLFGMVRRNIR